MLYSRACFLFFFFNDTATTEIYTLSLHDALPIWTTCRPTSGTARSASSPESPPTSSVTSRSEEHTSELQSRLHLVCRLLLEKKKKHGERHCHPPPCNDRSRRTNHPSS